eukprot:564290-Rhodomonas_salina.1
MDYFRACGATSLCEQRCGAEIAAFESLNAVDGGTRPAGVYTQSVRSLFFVDDGGVGERRAPF